MEFMEIFSTLFRWFHVFFGILWIGLLYFFNFVNGPFATTMDGDTKKKVVPELMPRALFWFRWGALWTWVTGVLLLMLVFYHGGIMFNEEGSWSAAAGLMILLTFAAPFAYDALAKSGLAKNKRVFGIVSWVLIGIVAMLMYRWANFSYRAYNIHLAVMLGTIMAYNVWFRIWPNQQKIITAVKSGEAPNPDLVAVAGTRSRHNTYMSVPLVWGMLNAHTTYWSGGNLGMLQSCGYGVFLVVVALGWHIVWQCYKKAGNVKGF
jgi:uncharacterized membrane protein